MATANKKPIKNNTLSEEMIKNIDNYSNDIQTIENFVDAVRMRPGMYIGPLGGPGFLNMLREVFQNALDQLVSAKSPCDLIYVVYDTSGPVGKVTISDNGMGIPFKDINRVYTTAHTSKNFVKQKGDYSAGLNGIGAKATNALSSEFQVYSYSYTGRTMHVIFRQGKVVKEEILPNPEGRQGTEIIFVPDQTIMGDTTLDSGMVYLLIRDMLSLTAIGNKVDYTSIGPNHKVFHDVIVNEDGIITNLIGKCEAMLVTPIIVGADTGFMKLDAAFTFDTKNMEGENITSFANMCPTSTAPANTHVKGFLDGVCSWFVKYMNTVYLGEKYKHKATINDVKASLCAMISAFHLDPQFTGQAKEVFSNADYVDFAKQTVIAGMENWAKAKPQDLQRVCKWLKEVIEVRVAADKEKTKVTAKYTVSATTGLPQKYRRPTGPASEGWELVIVEGDSAESSASQGRDERRQGIFPIRGKILNVYDATPDKIRANAEIMGIVNILGAGYGKTFDITKVKFKKIIFLTDADADGAHIASLLLLLFLKLFPGLIEAGMVYKAVPPLYGIVKGKKHEYFTERIDFAKYMQKQFYATHKVSTVAGVPLSPLKFANILVENDGYCYEMEQIYNRYKIDPNLLEILLIAHVNGDSFAKIRKTLTSTYRFLKDENVIKDGNTIKIKGNVNKGVQTVFYNERFINDCKAIIPYVQTAASKNEMKFILDGRTVGLHELVHTVEAMMNVNLDRYKGLGEMDGEQLGESALRPDSNRTLIRYTVEDIAQDIQIIRMYESNKKLILDRIDKVNRIDLIG